MKAVNVHSFLLWQKVYLEQVCLENRENGSDFNFQENGERRKIAFVIIITACCTGIYKELQILDWKIRIQYNNARTSKLLVCTLHMGTTASMIEVVMVFIIGFTASIVSS